MEPYSFPGHALHYGFHLVLGIQSTDIVLARELADITVQMLLADPVIRAMKGTFEQRPERFYSVRVGKVVNRGCYCPDLAAMIDPEVITKPLVATMLISEYRHIS